MSREKENNNPNIALRILGRIIDKTQNYGLFGDMKEIYQNRMRQKGKTKANIWLGIQIVKLLPVYFSNILQRNGIMLKNYFKIALRNFSRNKVTSATNVIGLAVGLTCSLLIAVYVMYELSYDRYHENADNIYRVGYEVRSKLDPASRLAWVSFLVGPALENDYPEIVHVVHVRNGRGTVAYEQKRYNEDKMFFAGKDFFKTFSFPLIQGDAETVLREPFTAVMTRSTAQKYFGSENPVGKVLQINDEHNYTVTGLMEDVRENSHFTFDLLLSHATREQIMPWINGWYSLGTHTYILAADGISGKELEAKIRDLPMRYAGEFFQQYSAEVNLFLQRLNDIHLRSNLRNEIEANGNIAYIYIFLLVGLFVLLIACFNFMNLITAQAIRRNKEIGVRKYLGSTKTQLVNQFCSEAVLQSTLAFFASLFLFKLLFPAFASFVGRELNNEMATYLPFALTFFVLALGIGLFAGSYPGIVLSLKQPLDFFAGKDQSIFSGETLRRGLVVVQFSISLVLIIGTIIVYDQLDFMLQQPLGYDKEQKLAINYRRNRIVRPHYQSLQQELVQHINIRRATVSSSLPGFILLSRNARPEGAQENEHTIIQTQIVDYDFLDAYDMKLAAGRNFQKTIISDTSAFILNETAVQQFGWTADQAVGKTFYWGSNKQGPIIGVIKDYHHRSLHSVVEPIVMYVGTRPNDFGFLSLDISAQNVQDTINFIMGTLENRFPGEEFDYFFLDEHIQSQYDSETKLHTLLNIFSGIAIFIGCLGLFVLVSFSAERRTREIGIRKVLGASIHGIMMQLSGEFTKWIILSNVIGWPIVYYGMTKWLENFAYRIEIGVTPFIQGAAMVLVLALLVISLRSVKAALANPVHSLRYE